MTWRKEAACRGLDPDLFFPQHSESAEQPLAVCARCSVRHECLNYALSLPERTTLGIWGGTTVIERRLLRKKAS